MMIKKYNFVFWANGLVVVLILLLFIYEKFSLTSIETLFIPPVAPQPSSERFLTYIFQILSAVPVIICAFTWGLLIGVQPDNKSKNFILGSALITGGFLLNEIFRVHIILLHFGIPKLLTISFYALAAFLYAGLFRKEIKSTPYPLLLFSIGLLLTAVVIDSRGLEMYFSSLLEGFPKLFSAVNLAVYFWYICYKQLSSKAWKPL